MFSLSQYDFEKESVILCLLEIYKIMLYYINSIQSPDYRVRVTKGELSNMLNKIRDEHNDNTALLLANGLTKYDSCRSEFYS